MPSIQVPIPGAVATSGVTEINSNNLPNMLQEGGKEYVLLSTGTRTKLLFKVYALGCYVEKKSLESILKQLGKAKIEEMKKAKTLCDTLMKTLHSNKIPTKFVICMLRTVEGKKMSEAMCEAIGKFLTKEQLSVEEKKIEAILPPGEDIKEGDILQLELNGDALRALKNHTEKQSLASNCSTLNEAIMKVYITTDLVNDFQKRLVEKCVAMA